MMKKKGIMPTVTKYLFSLILTLMTITTTHNAGYFFSGAVELLLIATLSEVLVAKKRSLGVVCNSILLLLYNIQMMVLFFGNSYVALIMLTNVDSISGLSGKALEYGLGVVSVLVFSFIPIRSIKRTLWTMGALTGGLVLEICLVLSWGGTLSPFLSYYDLLADSLNQAQVRRDIASAINMSEINMSEINISENNMSENNMSQINMTSEFYSDSIADFRRKDENIVDQPNVILIFAEGLSQHVISDERNIMPNVAQFQKESLSFSDYYNHTFATYRGLIGQLYSGFQFDNYDTNTLVSLQGIFKDSDYATTFINTEPENVDFTAYLNSFGFDEVKSDDNGPRRGSANSVSDKDAYEILFDTMLQKQLEDKPFFISIYTFGTHVSLDSPDEKFGDGADTLLNRFYNHDVWFGAFIEAFKQSKLSDNTIVVFTTDHATYADSDYTKTFPNIVRSSMVDEIPLFIYYKGITPAVIDAGGRNSLCMAPSLLDYLDISAPNYFLGDSLFGQPQDDNLFDKVFTVSASISNDWGNGEAMSVEKRQFIEGQIQKYFIANRQEQSNVATNFMASEFSSIDNQSIFKVDISQDYTEMNIIFETTNQYESVWFPVWSFENMQEDLQWYKAEQSEDGIWLCTVNMFDFYAIGEYIVEIYVGEEEPQSKLTTGTVIVTQLPVKKNDLT